MNLKQFMFLALGMGNPFPLQMRWRASKEHRRAKNRIRSFMYYYGINPPSDFNPEHWSLGFIHWLNQVPVMPTRLVLIAEIPFKNLS